MGHKSFREKLQSEKSSGYRDERIEENEENQFE